MQRLCQAMQRPRPDHDHENAWDSKSSRHAFAQPLQPLAANEQWRDDRGDIIFHAQKKVLFSPYCQRNSTVGEAAADVISTRALHKAHALSSTRALFRPVAATLENRSSCCLRIVVLGGSTACGCGQFDRDTRLNQIKTSTCGMPAGMNGTWSAHLVRHWNARYASCCPQGHSLANLCTPGKGSDYIVDALWGASIDGDEPSASTETSLAAASIATAHLIFVDFATNDYNAWFLHEFKRTSEERVATILQSSSRTTERLVRKLRRLAPRAAAMYVETAYFYQRDGGVGHTLGAWPQHEPVLRHYGLPAVVVGLALEEEALRLGLGHERPERKTTPAHPLSRHWMMQDKTHLSAEGHQLTALLVARSLEKELSTSSSLPPVQASLPLRQFGEEKDEVEERTPHLRLDFTDKRGAWASHVPDLRRRGWEWLLSRKAEGSSYRTSQFVAGTEVGQGKLGLVAVAEGASFVVTNVTLLSGKLRAGFLRSYSSNMGAVEVSLVKARRGGSLPAPRCVLNGTWPLRISVFANEDCEWKLEGGDAGAKHELHFRMLPQDQRYAGRFTVYSVTAW